MSVPNLRFQGFDNEWQSFKLESLIRTLKSGLSRKLNNRDIGIPVLRANNIQNGKLDFHDIKYWYIDDPQGANTQNYLVQVGDVLINFINSEAKMGTTAFVKKKLSRDMIYTTNILRMTTNEKLVNYFFHLYSQTQEYKNYIKVITKPAVNQASFTTVDFKAMDIIIPHIEEQQKIADFFTLLDRRIEQQQEKVEAWHDYKKGMMQKLFSRELRFKDEDGQEFPEWATSKLEKLSIITMGQSPNGEAYSDNPENVVLIQGNADMKNGFVVPRVYTSEITKMCDIGDIIMSVRAPVGALAKSGIAACIGRGVCSIKANDYIYHYLFYFNEIEGWEKLSQGSTFESVNSTDIKSLEIPTPSSIEQEKIADYLSSLDKKIEYEGKKLELFREQKKGFMQQMFI